MAEVFAADGTTGGSTGIVGLTGKAQPLVRWGTRGMDDRPIVSARIYTSSVHGGTKNAFRFFVDFDTWVEAGTTGLGYAIADRIETLFNFTNMNSTARTNPQDFSTTLRAMEPLPELDEGRERVLVTYECRWNR
jgi:hypothetical protein